MPTCRICNKKGLFLTVNIDHVCSACEQKARFVLQENLRLYNNSRISLNDPANPGEVKRCIQDIRAVLNQLIVLEKKNLLSRKNTMPTELLAQLEDQHDIFYLDCFEDDFNALVTQVSSMKVKKYQIARIDKFIDECNKYKVDLKNENSLGELIFKAMMLKNSLSEG